jgi:hypothetical protein
MKKNFIREMINNKRIVLHFVPTHLNVADVLTKPLPAAVYNNHIDKLMNGFGGDKELLDYLSEAATLTIDNAFNWL